MSALILSRIQFAATAMFHFLFVPLTLGLSVLIAWWEWRYVRTNDATYLRMARFWGKLFLINFALGIVTGITMEFQFGMNWAEFSKFAGDVFGAPLAIEATAAFFLESTFIGLWALGWTKVSKKTHALAITIVAFASNLSGLWILLANGWMQRPVGFVLRNGRAEMTSFKALVFNGTAWSIFLHTVLSGFTLAAFFVLGVSAYHLLRKREAGLASRRGRVPAAPLLLKLLPLAIPLPYLAIQLGWVVAEVGRQPWLVYGVFKTADGASKSVSAGQVAFSLAGFVLVYGILAAVDAILLVKYARKGPEEASR